MHLTLLRPEGLIIILIMIMQSIIIKFLMKDSTKDYNNLKF